MSFNQSLINILTTISKHPNDDVSLRNLNDFINGPKDGTYVFSTNHQNYELFHDGEFYYFFYPFNDYSGDRNVIAATREALEKLQGI